MNKHANILIAVTGLALLGGCGGNMGILLRPVNLSEPLDETTVGGDKGMFIWNKVAIIDLDGVIMNERTYSMFGAGENPVSLFVEKLDAAERDSSVRAVIIRINSPGGGVTASDIMHERLMKFRARRGIPVVALIEDVGASGGYYVACGADRILAHPTSITGSIGVIMQTLSLAGTMRMIGIEAKAVTSGPMKDMASPFKPLDKKDLAVLQTIIDAYYERFLTVVGKSRTSLSAEKVRELADGRIYSATQALDNGLIDSLGYMSDAFELAKKLSKTTRARAIIYHRPYGYRANFYSTAVPGPPQINLINISAKSLLDSARPRFMYLWTGRSAGR